MSNQVYANQVLENKLESILSTKVDLNNYLHADNSLAEAPGLKKVIHIYKAVGQVDEVAMTEGNSHNIESSFETREYEVGTTQARGIYYDEEAMKDPMVVDTIVSGMAEEMQNDFTRKAINEMKKSSKIVECDFSTTSSGYFFGKVVDALALLGERAENLNMLISPNQQAYIRKQLGDDLKYSEGFARTGYIGSVAGVPVVMSAAVPDSACFIVNREAVTLFLKKGAEAEQERDADHRKNSLFLRKVALVALTDERYIVELAKAQSTACAITTYVKAAKTIAGSCGANCYLVKVVDGDGEKYDVTPSNGSQTMSAKANLTAGDKINAVAYEYGFAPKAATEVTVAA